MPDRPKIYLAGPDVFRPDADARGDELKALAHRNGFEPLWPLGLYSGALPVRNDTGEDWHATAHAIFAANRGGLDRADAVVANIEPFRGPGMDQGTAWEIGYALGRGIPVFAYTLDARSYAHRCWPLYGEAPKPGAVLLGQKDGMQIENFGLEENLMISCSIQTLHSDARGALQAAKKHFEERADARQSA